jgi:hypothetical protein
MDWERLSTTSHYQTAIAVRDELLAGDVGEATRGIEELIDALGRSERRALRSQLTRLMTHILKWQMQPKRRTRSWAATITDARIEIEAILDEEPSQRRYVTLLWDKCFVAAKKIAQAETGTESTVDHLSEEEVFNQEFRLDDD